MKVMLRETLALRRFQAILTTAFASRSLILAAVGLFGVISHSISARTRELAIRIALGADASFIWRLVLGDGMKMVITGIVIGLAAALLCKKRSPSGPAQRALSTDPLSALRCESI